MKWSEKDRSAREEARSRVFEEDEDDDIKPNSGLRSSSGDVRESLEADIIIEIIISL